MQVKKEKGNLSLAADDMIFVNYPKDSTKQLLVLMSEFSKLYKVNTKNQLYFYILAPNNWKIMTPPKIKYLGIKLTRDVQIYTENYKTLLRESKNFPQKFLQNFTNHVCKLEEPIVKMAVLPKEIYRSHTIPIKIQTGSFVEIIS